MRTVSILTLLVASLASLLCLGCGPVPVTGAPILSELHFDGQAEKNPMVLLFSFEFEDDAGDLSDGKLTPLVNDKGTGEEPLLMLDIMLASGVALEAKQGKLFFNLEVEMPDPAPEAGSTFAVGIEVTDEAGNTSNRPNVKLRIDYP